MKYLIYGAYGFTGRLIVNQSAVSSLSFDIAGRDAEKTRELAEEYNVRLHVFGMSDGQKIRSILSEYDTVIHCAGPFSQTAQPMVEACIDSKTNYIDITGEIEVFEMLHNYDKKAKDAGIFILPGAGFDVVPTDCMAAFLYGKLPDATHLELGFKSNSNFSRGTALTMAESMHKGSAIRENGKIKWVPNAYKTREIEKDGKRVSFVSIPWGDVSTAYHSTGIPNVTVYFGAHPKTISQLKKVNAFKWIFGIGFVQGIMKSRIRKKITGPKEELRKNSRTWVWGEVKNENGDSVFAEIHTQEGYELTANSVVTIMKKLSDMPVAPGFNTPSMAFGADYVLEMPETSRNIVS